MEAGGRRHDVDVGNELVVPACCWGFVAGFAEVDTQLFIFIIVHAFQLHTYT
jgi:hypothetical protein